MHSKVNLTNISKRYLRINKMKIDLTTGTWQDNPGCPINITLVSTSDGGVGIGCGIGLCCDIGNNVCVGSGGGGISAGGSGSGCNGGGCCNGSGSACVVYGGGGSVGVGVGNGRMCVVVLCCIVVVSVCRYG
jgi:hypothetical protein